MEKDLLLTKNRRSHLSGRREIPYWLLLLLGSLFKAFMVFTWLCMGLGWFSSCQPCGTREVQGEMKPDKLQLFFCWSNIKRFFSWRPPWESTSCFLKKIRLMWQIEPQRWYFVSRCCWKTGSGERRESWINAPNVQMVPVWAQTVLLDIR